METSLLQPVIVMMRKDFAVMRKDFAEPRDLYKTSDGIRAWISSTSFLSWTTRHDKISLFFFLKSFFLLYVFFGGV